MCQEELIDLLSLEVQLVLVVALDGVLFADSVVLLCQELLEGQHGRLGGVVGVIPGRRPGERLKELMEQKNSLKHYSKYCVIIIITFKGAVQDFFYNLLTALQTMSNTHAQVALAQLCANHVQHIERSSCATCRVTNMSCY